MDAHYLKSVFSPGDLPRDRRPEVAVAGKSNVGKSSLLNRLVNRRQLARTSQTPGKTRCLNFYLVEPDRPPPFYLVDMPGYGYARVSQKMRGEWATLIDAYLGASDRPAGLIALFDARREPTEDDRDWLAWLGEWDRPFLLVLTKTDKLSGNERVRALRRWGALGAGERSTPLCASGVTGAGIDKIWQWIDGVRYRAADASVRSAHP